MPRKPKRTKEEKLEGLKEFLDRSAKRLSKERTKWESIMFKNLSDLHYKFKFQVPVIHNPTKGAKAKGYIIDFLLTDYNLIIEVDGISTHGTKAAQRADNQRTKKLKSLGYELIRFWNKQVSTYSKETIDTIIKTKLDMLKSLKS